METKLHSFYPFTAVVISLLYFAAYHSVAIGDTGTNNGPSSNCRRSSCPCKCEYTNSVLDCSNRAQSNHDVQTIIDRCESVPRKFANFNFSNSNIQHVFFTVYAADDNRECSLDLSRNEISQMWRIHFYDCNPVFVDVSHNYLTNLPEAVYVWYYNPIDVTKSTHTKIDFSHNQIASLRNFIASNLYWYNLNATEKTITIDLSYNRIIVLSIPNELFFFHGVNFQVWTLEKVTIILHNNQISSLESYPNTHYIKNLSETHVLIDLRNNHLSSLPEATEMIEALSFNLEGNQWNCDCHQKWVSHNSSKLRQSLSHEESTQPYCLEPQNVKRRPLLNLTSGEFVCPPEEDWTVALTFTPSLIDTVELTCPIVGGDPPIENIEWKIWTKSGLPKPFKSETVCGNCPLVVKTSTSNWEGIYHCTAYNGINVSSSVNISLSQTNITDNNKSIDPKGSYLFFRESHLTWLNIILVSSLVIVFSGFIVVSYKLHRGNQKENSNEENTDAVACDTIPSYSSPPVTFSKQDERVSTYSEYLEPTNQVTRESGVEYLQNEVSYQRGSATHARKVSTDKSSDGSIQNTDRINHQKTGLIPASRYYNIKRSIEPKSGNQDDDDYEVTSNERYTPLNVVDVYEGHITYQGLNCPDRSSSQI